MLMPAASPNGSILQQPGRESPQDGKSVGVLLDSGNDQAMNLRQENAVATALNTIIINLGWAENGLQ